MCGIAGLFTSEQGAVSGPGSPVQAMADSLIHRGPDDSGIWTDQDAGIALAFRRLSIIDLSQAGHQPMCSASGRYVMVFNGEVYNHSDLRRALPRDIRYRGHSDTEVILAAVEAWGVEGAVERFVGQFAIALWDREERTLTLIRDRLGIKPLFVYSDGRQVMFGSELKAIMAALPAKPAIDMDALASYLRYLYIPAPRSVFVGVQKLRAGHILKIHRADGSLPESRPYWSLEDVVLEGRPMAAMPRDPVELVEEVEGLLAEATYTRTFADVPVGAFLSGGIDSSTVVALMQAKSGRPVRTFTVAFDRPEHDEAPWAARVADVLGTDHTEVRLSGDDALALVGGVPEVFDEPLADPSQLPTYLVSQVARRDVTVALSGDGGDEVFGGYNRYVHGAPLLWRLAQYPAWARGPLGRGAKAMSPSSWDRVHQALAPMLPASLRHRLPGEKVHKTAELLRQDSVTGMYRSLMSALQRPEDHLTSGSEPDGALDRVLEGTSPLEERMMLADQLEYLPDDLLAKVDRASMAVSLEVRVPMLDHRIVERAWSLPLESKIRDGTGKWILKEILYRHVPRDLVDRPKVGFSVPVSDWLRGELVEWAGDLLSPESVSRDGIFRADTVERTWRDFRTGRTRDGLGVWSILMFQAWYDRWMH